MSARDDWGLHISKAREGSAEPDYFFEPAHLYIAFDGTLYFGWIQTSPFARPQIDDIACAIKFRLDKDYPPLGGYYRSASQQSLTLAPARPCWHRFPDPEGKPCRTHRSSRRQTGLARTPNMFLPRPAALFEPSTAQPMIA